MKPTINLLFITLLFCLVFGRANAQTNATDLTPAHLQAAENFLSATGVNKQFESIMDNMTSAFGNQIPQDKKAAFADVMKKFMNKYFTWDILKVEMSKIYAQEFTEKELQQLTDFYNTDIGKKYSGKLTVLTQKGMVVGQQTMSLHQAELQEMIKEAFKTP